MTAHAPGEAVHVRGLRAQPWWQGLKRALTLAFFALVTVLLVTMARRVEWREVLDVLREYPARRLVQAAALAVLAHAIYASYDLLGRAWTQHRVPVPVVVAITFASYAFNLNLGTWVGGFAFRYRLYSRFGLPAATTTRVVGLSIATNWLGYLVLGGTVFALGLVTPPPGWGVGAVALRGFGVAMLVAAAAYLLLCGASKRREWTLRGHVIALPPLPLAVAQVAVACAHWSAVAGALALLLGPKLPYASVLGTLLIAAVAGVIAHIPAGLGVLEAVFIALLGDRVPQGQLIAVLLAYRALYYLVPLLLACVVFITLEARARRQARAGTPLAD